ncbi:hypothetical protein QYF36_025107 [Acer negundo]|nr:hypothetical protein QYF36_025107 [Acer negundo]
MYCKCALIDSAHKVFDENTESMKLSICYNALLSGYVLNLCYCDAFLFFGKMRELGVEINAVTMLSLIPACAGLGYFWLGTFMHCCCVKSGLVVDLSVANFLVTMYMKCGSVDYGRRLFNEIPEKGLFTWNAMISGYAQNGLASHVLELYREMKTCGVFPDAVTFVGVLSSVAHLGARSVGCEVEQQIAANGFGRNPFLSNALINMYSRCGNLKKTRAIFDHMPVKSVVSWTAIIGGYGMHGQGEVAVQLFDEMIRIGVRPDSTAFVCVLSACSHAGSGAPPRKFKGKKSKVAAKSGGQMYQWEIMRSVGISDSEISEFQAPEKWLKYFPPLAVEDLKAFGLGCDWRRSFVTTEINPFYDSFVRWQLRKLKSMGKIIKDVRYTMYSPIDDQPCAVHDRASGEGVQPQEYTHQDGGAGTIPSKIRSSRSPKPCRPEFLQDSQEAYLVELTGCDLIGLPLNSPLAFNKVINVLPMLNVLTDKGTGIVTYVPSDSPDDYMAMHDLKAKPALRNKFGVKDEWILPFEIIPVINIPEFGDKPAEKLCTDLKIKSQNDKEKLAEAKRFDILERIHGWNNACGRICRAESTGS